MVLLNVFSKYNFFLYFLNNFKKYTLFQNILKIIKYKNMNRENSKKCF